MYGETVQKVPVFPRIVFFFFDLRVGRHVKSDQKLAHTCNPESKKAKLNDQRGLGIYICMLNIATGRFAVCSCMMWHFQIPSF